MRRLFVIATVIALFLGLTAGLAAAGVERNQVEEREFAYEIGGFHHTYTVQSTCGASTATGYLNPEHRNQTETFDFFHLTDTHAHFRANYDWTTYWHEFEGTSTDGGRTYIGSLTDERGEDPRQATLTLLDLDFLTNYRNHGQYVKGSANKKEAAQSCLGKPVVSR